MIKTEAKSDKLYTLVIPGRLPNLNEYINAERANRQQAARLKRETQEKIGWCIKKHLRDVQFTEPVNFLYEWHEKDCRRDKDNVAFAKKFVQDALVQYGVLRNDGWGEVADFSDQFCVDKNNARVVVRMWINREQGLQIPKEERCPLCGVLKE